jgi:8-oxo-dGTP pyrophosphatase MutT (NUDIX family)
MRLGSPKVTFGACAVIRDAQGRVLLAHHTYRRRAWGLPGGLAGADEQPAQTLARELHEELGVQATVGPLLHADLSEPNGHLTLYYAVDITGTPRHDGVEIDGYRYVAPDEVVMLLGAEDAPWLAAA